MNDVVQFHKSISESSYHCEAYTDIDVMPGVKSITFSGKDKKTSLFYLSNILKQFPDIEELVIKPGVQRITISNFMFPNVKRIISNNENFKSGSVLIQGDQLLNSFCKKKEEVIDLNGVKSISTHALDGCMSINFINDDQVNYCSKNAFAKSIITLLPEKYFRLGQIFFLRSGSTVELDDQTVPVHMVARDDCKSQINIQKLIIHNAKSISALLSAAINNIIIDEIDIQDNNCIFSTAMCGYHNTKITLNTTLYKTVDDMIYTSDMKILVYCKKQSDVVTVPEGVEIIDEYAFSCSNVQSVKLPNSLKLIMQNAFFNTYITSIEFGNNIEFIHEKAFPGTLKEVCLPSSLSFLANNAFDSLDKIYAESLPRGIIDNMLAEEQCVLNNRDFPDNLLAELHYKGRILYLPKYMSLSIDQKKSLYMKLRADPDMYDITLYENIKDTRLKQETALQLYEKTNDNTVLAYLHRAANSIAARYINTCREDALVKLLKMELLNESKLKKLLLKVQIAGMTSASAYILNLINGCRKESFRL